MEASIIYGIQRFQILISQLPPTGIEMRSKISKIPDEVLREIFPEKLRRRETPEELYTLLKKMILSGKLKKGQKLTHKGIANDFKSVLRKKS